MLKPWDTPNPVRVEIATNDRTQAPQWTDISLAAKGGTGITVSRTPRPGPFQKTPPNRLALSVDNSTGQFSDVVGFAPTLFQKRLRVSTRDWTVNGNLLANPDFNVANGVTGWNGSAFGYAGTATVAVSTTRSLFGHGQSLLATWPTQAAGTTVSTTASGCVIGRQYEAVYIVWVPAGSPAVKIQDIFGTQGGTSTTTGAWQVLRVRWTANASTHNIGLTVTGTTAGQQVWIGAARVDEGWTTGALVTTFTTLAAAGHTNTPLAGASGSPVSYRFTGDISGNSVGFPARGRAITPITAVDRSARLASRTRTFRSVPIEEPMSDSPYVLYPLNEQGTSISAGDIGPNAQPPLTIAGSGAAPTFGTVQLVTTSDDTGASFTAGKYLINTGPMGGIGGINSVTFGAVLRTTVAAAQTIVALHDVYGPGFVLSTTSSGTVKFDWLNPFDSSGTPRPSLTSTATVNDGQPHHTGVTATQSGGNVTLRLYVDGNLEATSSAIPTTLLPAFIRIAVGGTAGLPGFTGTIGLVGAWNVALSGAQVTEHSAAALNGFTGEATYARLIRYCRWAGIAQSEIVLDATATYAGLMSHVDSKDVAPWDMMGLCETVEGGLLNVDGAGNIRFRSRGSFYNQPAWATLTADYTNGGAAATLESSLEFPTDTANVVNDLEGTRPGGATQRVINSASISAYQRAEDQVTIPATTDDAVADALEWRVAILSNPKPAADGVAVRLTGPTITDALTAQVLALEPGARIDLTDLPPQAPASTVSYQLEGWEERYTHSDGALWTATTGPLPPAVWTVEDPVYGTLDGPGVLAY